VAAGIRVVRIGNSNIQLKTNCSMMFAGPQQHLLAASCSMIVVGPQNYILAIFKPSPGEFS
jgi:hypothetical protein